MTQIVRVGLALGLGSLLGFLPGCGGYTPGQSGIVGGDKIENAQSIALSEVGDMLRIRAEGGGPPKNAADLAKYEKLFAVGYPKVKRGDIVLFYGIPLEDGAADKVLAYEKKTPESGGLVLMQDGKTIKKMTPDEFKAAPKSGTKS
jgi:hypothetical protein